MSDRLKKLMISCDIWDNISLFFWIVPSYKIHDWSIVYSLSTRSYIHLRVLRTKPYLYKFEKMEPSLWIENHQFARRQLYRIIHLNKSFHIDIPRNFIIYQQIIYIYISHISYLIPSFPQCLLRFSEATAYESRALHPGACGCGGCAKPVSKALYLGETEVAWGKNE